MSVPSAGGDDRRTWIEHLPLRSQLVVVRNRRTIAAVALVLGLALLAGAGWLAIEPPTTEVTEETHAESIETELKTSAVVTANDSVWEEGTRLEDRPLYLLEASPELTVAVETTGPEGATVVHEVDLHIEALDGDVSFWESEERLLEDERTLEDGTGNSTVVIDVEELEERLEETREGLSGVGQLEATLEFRAKYGTGDHSGTLSGSAPLQVDEQSYAVSGQPSDGETHTAERTREVPLWYAPHASAVLGFVGSVAIAGGGLLLRRFPASEEVCAETIRERLDRRKFSEWISSGKVPIGVGTKTVQLDSLEDLVDVAIDSSQRVVHDTDRDLYVVVTNDIVYYYSPGQIDWYESAFPPIESLGREGVSERPPAGSAPTGFGGTVAKGPGDDEETEVLEFRYEPPEGDASASDTEESNDVDAGFDFGPTPEDEQERTRDADAEDPSDLEWGPSDDEQ